MDEARAFLVNFNLRCTPPWSDEELAHKLSDANEFLWLRGRLLLPSRPGTPHDFAGHILARPEFGHLRFWRSDWFVWTGQTYEPIDENDMPARINNALHEIQHAQRRNRESGQPRRRGSVSRGLVANVTQALAGLCLVDADVEMPSWLNREGPRDVLALENGLIDVVAASRGVSCLQPHTPRWFGRVALPYRYDPAATCPRWLAVLNRSLGDPGLVQLFQEWCGYCLTSDLSHQKFVLMHGEGANGKSVACAVLVALLGGANVSHVPLERFGDRFSLGSTIGKMANVASEIGEIDRAAEGVLKAMTAGDPITLDRKFRPPVSVLPTARLTFATNNLPRFCDRSSGIWRRVLLLPFNHVIGTAERIAGMDKSEWWAASGELPGILNWALQGLRRLRDRGSFSPPELSTTELDRYRTESNPARLFLGSFCSAGPPTERQPKGELYSKYRKWCEENGYSYPLAAPQFGREVRRVFPGVVDGKTGTGVVPRADCYVGVSYCPGGIELVPTS